MAAAEFIEDDFTDDIHDIEAVPVSLKGPLLITREVKRFKGFFQVFGERKRSRQSIDYDDDDSDLSSTRSHSSCSSLNGPTPNQCINCPLRRANYKNLYASAWTEKQTMMLQWNPSEFPDIDSDPNAMNMEQLDLPGNSVSNWCLTTFCLKPIMQWLIGGTGPYETPPVTVESEVSTVSVSEVVKNDILKELAGSHICKIAMAIREATDSTSVKTLSICDLEDVILAVPDVPDTCLEQASLIYTEWLAECKKDKIEESTITALMNATVNLLLKTEELIPPKLYKTRSEGATKRTFDMCCESNTAECDYEVRVIRDGQPSIAKEWVDNYKVLIMSENKASEYRMERAYPQMACQFGAAAKHARFHTENHHILYNVSACGKNTVILARGHVWKDLVDRVEKCIAEEPEFENSHFLYRTVEFKVFERFNVFPILNVYLAVKAAVLLHLKTPMD